MSKHTLETPGNTRDSQPPSKRRRTDFTPSINGRHREIGLLRRDGEQDGSSFVGSSSGIFFVRSVYNALQNRSVLKNQTDLVPGEDDRLTSGLHRAGNTALWTPTEISDAKTITFDELRNMSDEYFNHWHPTFPYLHAPSFLESFEMISKLPLSSITKVIDPQEHTILKAVMSIAAADRRQCGRARNVPVPRSMLFHSYSEAIESVQQFLTLPASTKSLQAVLAVELFLVTMLRHNGATRLGGLAVRLAFQLGLHRCPVRYSTFSSEEAQMRKRIFWTTYCLDRILCQSLGLPLGIRDDDIDVCSFDYEKHQDPTLPQTPLQPRLASLHFLSKHARIKGMIVEMCNKNIESRPINAEMCDEVDKHMGKWRNEIDDFIDLNPSNTEFSKARKAALQAVQYECVIALNRPLLALSKDSRDYTVALQTCINASRNIIGGLHTKLIGHLGKVASNDDNRVLTPLFWPSFTWMTWMSAFIILYAASNGELPVEVAKQLVEKSIEVLGHLSSRGTVWPDACAAAIRELSAKLEAPPQQVVKQVPETDYMTPPLSHDYIAQQQQVLASQQAVPFQTPVLDANHYTIDQQQPYVWPPEASLLVNDMSLFDGFDIPFWMGDDQYSGMVSDFTALLYAQW